MSFGFCKVYKAGSVGLSSWMLCWWDAKDGVKISFYLENMQHGVD